MRSSIAIPLIQEILLDQDPDVRAEGLYSLMKLKIHREHPPKKNLKDSDPKARIAALRGLFKHGERID